MAWLPEDRRNFLRGLETTETALLVFYKCLLYILIPTVTLLAALFFRSVSNDSFRDFLRLYGGILYLIFLAWAVGQLFAIRNRQSRGPSGGNASSPADPKIEIKISKHPDKGARRFSFQFGFGAPGSSSPTKPMRIGLSLSSVADEDKLDDAALDQAAAYVTAGSGLDMICRLLNPRYKDWSSPQQQIYRAYLENQLELRPAASQVDESFASATANKTRPVQTSDPEATSSHFPEAEAPRSRQGWFTLAPIVWFFFISFIMMTITACLGWLLFFSRGAQH